MKNKTIDKIRTQISEIQNLSSDDGHFRLKLYVDSILTKLMELIGQTDNERGEKEFLLIWKRLDYANEKEVKFAERAFFEARKKKARKIREDDYHKKLERAKSQVKLDLSKIYTLERFDQ